MSDEQTIYISPEDDLTTVRERLGQTPDKRLTLVIPSQTQLRSHVAWKLLYQRARELSKEILIVSSDPQVRSVAHAVKFKVAHSLESSPLTGKSRSGSRSSRPTLGKSHVPGSRSPNKELPSNPIRSISGTSERRSGSLKPKPEEPERPWYGAPPANQSASSAPSPKIEDLGSDDSLSGRPLFGVIEKPYDAQTHTTPPIYPLPLPEEAIEDEPDLWQEDYTRAQRIRKAAHEGLRQKGQKKAEAAESGQVPESPTPPKRNSREMRASKKRTSREMRSERVTQHPYLPDEPFSAMEDSQPPPRREQRARAIINDHDAIEEYNTPEITDLPSSPVDDDIEFRANSGDIIIPPPITPITIHTEKKPDEQQQNNLPPRTHGRRARQSRSGHLPPSMPENIPPSAPPISFDDDALPEIDEHPTQLFPPSSRRQSMPLGKQTPATRRSGDLDPKKSTTGARTGEKSRTSGTMGQQRPVESKSKTGNPTTRRPTASQAMGDRNTSLTERKGPATQSSTKSRTGTVPLPSGTGRSTASRSGKSVPGSRSGTPSRRPVTTGKRGQRSSSNRGAIIAGALAALVVIAVAAALYFGPSTTIVLTVDGRSYTHAVTVRAVLSESSNQPDGVIPAQPQPGEFTKSGDGTATGSRNVGTNKAKGLVNFTNNSEDTAINIPSGTIITTADGSVAFVTTAVGFVLPGKTGPVPIEAQEAGPEGDVDAETITIIPEESLAQIAQSQSAPLDPAALALTVINNEATDGGAAQERPVITQEDLDKVQEELADQVQPDIDAWVEELAQQGFVGTPTINSTLVNPPNLDDPDAVREDNAFSVTVLVTATALVVSNSDLQEEAVRQLNLFIDEEPDFQNFTILKGEHSGITLEEITQDSGDENGLELTYKANALAVPDLPLEELEDRIAGLSITDARATLEGMYTQITAVEITSAPDIIPWVTRWNDHITISIRPTTPAPASTD